MLNEDKEYVKEVIKEMVSNVENRIKQGEAIVEDFGQNFCDNFEEEYLAEACGKGIAKLDFYDPEFIAVGVLTGCENGGFNYRIIAFHYKKIGEVFDKLVEQTSGSCCKIKSLGFCLKEVVYTNKELISQINDGVERLEGVQ